MEKKLPIVLIEWEDAQTNHWNFSSSPEELLQEEGIDKCITRSVGFLLDKNKDRIIISDSLFDGRCKDTRTIPTGMIKKLTYLRKLKDG